VVHLHVDAALFELVEHLFDALAASLDPSGAADPSQIVIPLIERAFSIEVHDTPLLEVLTDIVRHDLLRSSWHGPILRRAGGSGYRIPLAAIDAAANTPGRYRQRGSEGDVRLPWMNRRPRLVEWDLTGSEESGFGAVVYLASAPVRIVGEIEPVFETDEQAADAVDCWLATVPDEYRLNADFQAFKATARRFSDDEKPERQAGQWWRALDT
jgi:hypothetical protein